MSGDRAQGGGLRVGLAIVVRGQDQIELRKRLIEAVFLALPPHDELAESEGTRPEEGLSWSCTVLEDFSLGARGFPPGDDERGNGAPPRPPLGPV